MNLIDTRFKGYVTFYKTQTRQSDITNYLYTYNESTKCDLFNKDFACSIGLPSKRGYNVYNTKNRKYHHSWLNNFQQCHHFNSGQINRLEDDNELYSK